MGIGGTLMGNLALLAKEVGHEVLGLRWGALSAHEHGARQRRH